MNEDIWSLLHNVARNAESLIDGEDTFQSIFTIRLPSKSFNPSLIEAATPKQSNFDFKQIFFYYFNDLIIFQALNLAHKLLVTVTLAVESLLCQPHVFLVIIKTELSCKRSHERMTKVPRKSRPLFSDGRVRQWGHLLF